MCGGALVWELGTRLERPYGPSVFATGVHQLTHSTSLVLR